MSAYFGEYLGTALLILMGNGVVASTVLKPSRGYESGWFTIVFAWGLAVLFAGLVSNRASGAHLNPALTLALAYVGNFSWAMVPGYILAQFAGACTGAIFVWLIYKPLFDACKTPESIFGCFATSSVVPGNLASFAMEFTGTLVLVLCILTIGDLEVAAGVAPILVAFLIMAIGFSLGGVTGFAINPARDLGPRLVHALLPIAGKGSSNWKYAWIPLLGPLSGALAGASFYSLITTAQ